MTTGAWEQIKERVGQLFKRGKEHDGDELERALELVKDAGADERRAIVAEAELRGELRQRLRTDPEFAAGFKILLDELRRELPQPTQPSLHQEGYATRGGTVIQAGRDVNRVSPPRS
ncbi:hypothetical protein [Kribbella speibonae]|uniref:Uncharacterized protein n=1 Tax=Kribbella speibonae TaxID=1572660 RepID=A0ABY2ABD0_9ACTN|nr:hypothetical protein [Kribbella speibonae]TCC26894.1 hypothetical protein E0H58_02475 [Kribbella speibonae]